MILVAGDPIFAEHAPGPGHPERPARLAAVERGLAASGLGEALVTLESRDATRDELERVHRPDYLDRLITLSEAGGGALDPDTQVSSASWAAAVRASGDGLAAAHALRSGRGDAAFLAVRPPGHHARPAQGMGFCLLNHIAVVAADLAALGDRVCILDWDAHHGNGTQEIFYDRSDVLYVSWHEWPLYPGTGALDDRGRGPGLGFTCNIPLPAGATGDVYLRSFDEVVAPLVESFVPDWILVSAGFDAHRADPLTGLGLSAGDFAALMDRSTDLAGRSGRTLAFLEGGYDLDALEASVAAAVPRLIGVEPVVEAEPPTSGGPGRTSVTAAADLWAHSG
ncbi:MAG: putative deacetylase [Actinomycetia bacterium]|nr:putative deacetylase [Actinomycetes bacterium]